MSAHPTSLASIVDRIDLSDPTGCWPWTGGVRNGYGKVIVRGVLTYVHRFVYEETVDPIPDGLVIDHLCRNTVCVNPDHMEPVTIRENSMRGEHPSFRAARTGVCKRGHSDWRTRPNGRRVCRTCVSQNNAAAHLRRKAVAA